MYTTIIISIAITIAGAVIASVFDDNRLLFAIGVVIMLSGFTAGLLCTNEEIRQTNNTETKKQCEQKCETKNKQRKRTKNRKYKYYVEEDDDGYEIIPL